MKLILFLAVCCAAVLAAAAPAQVLAPPLGPFDVISTGQGDANQGESVMKGVLSPPTVLPAATSPPAPLDTTSVMGKSAEGNNLYQVKMEVPSAAPCSSNCVVSNPPRFAEIQDSPVAVPASGAVPVRVVRANELPTAVQSAAANAPVATSEGGKPLLRVTIATPAPCACQVADSTCQVRCALLEIKSTSRRRARLAAKKEEPAAESTDGASESASAAASSDDADASSPSSSSTAPQSNPSSKCGGSLVIINNSNVLQTNQAQPCDKEASAPQEQKDLAMEAGNLSMASVQ